VLFISSGKGKRCKKQIKLSPDILRTFFSSPGKDGSSVAASQRDRMSLRKKITQNVAQTFFVKSHA
jgi:hypothetical protein